MDKKRKVGVGLCVLLLICGVLFSSAFYSAQIKTENVITFGDIQIKLLSYELDENNQEREVREQEQPLHTDTMSRIVRVQNVCSEPAFVRVKIDLTVENERGLSPAEGYVSMGGTDAAWVQDGQWFYYNRILEPDMMTENLMQGLTFDMDKLTRDYAGDTVWLHVEAQAVQSKHNGTEVLQAQGWPQEVDRS